MPDSAPEPLEPLSDVLGRMVADGDGPVTLDAAIDALGERSFGGALFIVALPAMFMPPGVAVIFGLTLLLISTEMLLSHDQPWLPARLRRLAMSRRSAKRIYAKAAPRLRSAEVWLRPRWPRLQSAFHERLIALACMALSIVLMLPLPVAHTLGALSLLAFGAGLMASDAAALLAGWGLATACALACVALDLTAVAGLKLI